jgi:ribosome maturation factor RimP
LQQNTDRIAALIEPSLNEMGYDLVRVAFTGGRRPTLQIMAERRDGMAMTVDDCADISRSVSAILDVADPIPEAYTLEVSSPGIDRPLIRPEDYVRFAGYEAKVETAAAVDGRKRFRGRVLGFENGQVALSLDDGTRVLLPFAGIARAKLLLTDELIAAVQRRQPAS